MATQKKTQIIITANATTAKKVIDELQQRIDGIKQKMSGLDVTTKSGQREFKKLEKELVSYNSAITQNITNTERINKAMKNLSGSSLNELKRALSAAKSELGKMSASSSGLKQMQGNVKALQTQIDNLTGSTKKQSSAWSTTMKNLTAYVGAFQMFNKAKALIEGVIHKNFEYSGSLTDIRKVSGMAMEDVNKLSNELAKIDTRTSVEGLAKLAYQGAKLGMGKYGVEGMSQFVKAADQINVAIGEEMGEEALPALSKMVETMGLIPKMGIEKAMLATGSAMFKLSSTSTATSNNIVEFSKRLTGISRTAGITTDQLLALGSASDALFLMPEVSATAMSKFIVALQKNHNLIEKDLGIQEGTIKQMYAAGHAMDAIVLVLEKMRDKGNMNALGGIFKDLGSDGQRLVTAMVTMSKNVDVLKDHLYESNKAFSEAKAVTDEYEMQQKSAIGILERANNLWSKAFVNPEGVGSVKAMAEAWYDVSEMITQSPIYKNSLHLALQSLLWLLQAIARLLPFFINLAVAQGIVSATKAVWGLCTALKAAVTAQKSLNLATSVNPYVALASVILSIIGVIYGYASAASEAAEAQAEAQRKANEWKNTLNEAAVETTNLQKKLSAYKRMLSETNLTQQERSTLISRFNKDFRQYISNLGIEIRSVKDLRDHYKDLANEVQKATYYRLREDARQQALPNLQKERVAAASKLMDAIKGAGIKGVEFNDIDRWMGKGMNANGIFVRLAQIDSQQNGAKNPNKDIIQGVHYSVAPNGLLQYSLKGGQKRWSMYQNNNLLGAVRYYVNSTNRVTQKDKEITDAYAPFVPEDYTPYTEDKLGDLSKDAPDKAAIAEAKRERRATEKAWRDELKQKQDEASAILDNVRNFYERQINEKLSQAISLGMDKTEQDLFVEPVKKRMNEALTQVSLAIAGQTNTWNEFKKTMSDDMLEMADATGVNLSENLLNNIQSNNTDALHAMLARLSSSLNRPMNSVTSEIFAKSTKYKQSNLTLEAKQLEARRKIAQENDFMGAVAQGAYDDFNVMGYANPNQGELLNKDAFEARKKAIMEMFEVARKGFSSLLDIDISNKEGQNALLAFLFGDDEDGMGQRIVSVLGDSAEEWRVFYHKLIQYSDNYTEAQKKTYDQQKKIADQVWAVNKRNLDLQERIRGIQSNSKLYGKQTTFLSNLGLANVKKDPEVELMKARMEAAQEYYDFVRENSTNQQLVAEADKSRQKAELDYANQTAEAMKSRLSQMKEFVQPIQDFGASAGQALAEMKNDAESANEAIKNALKSMLESWSRMALNSVNTQMWNAINEGGTKRALSNAGEDIVSSGAKAALNAEIGGGSSKSNKKRIKDERKHQKDLTKEVKTGIKERKKETEKGASDMAMATDLGNKEQTKSTELAQDAMVSATSAALETSLVIKKANDQETIQSDAERVQASTTLSIAGAMAKCFEFLGPIAGPIAAAVVMSTLTGLLQWAISSAFSGSKKSSNSSSKSAKITSGMLTYDSGNVQDLKPFVSNDGSVYWAKEGNVPSSGVSLLTQPTATTINGRPSLVAENGPELVIGRETTQAMMMNNPALIKALVNYDKNFSGRNAYDSGNIQEALGRVADISSSTASSTADVIASNATTQAALIQAVSTLLQRLNEPINAKIEMYGRGNLYESMSKANQFMKNK